MFVFLLCKKAILKPWQRHTINLILLSYFILSILLHCFMRRKSKKTPTFWLKAFCFGRGNIAAREPGFNLQLRKRASLTHLTCLLNPSNPHASSAACSLPQKKTPTFWLGLFVSEEVGFEPTLPLLVILFSRQTHSATLPLFQILM